MKKQQIDTQDRFRGCLLGLAVGDALGAAVEFYPRGTFQPLTTLRSGGPFHLKAGQWTDDTSLALCLGYSLVEQGGFDAQDQMDRYLRWYDEGYMSSTGVCFDVGGTTRWAINTYANTGDPLAGVDDPTRAGNGSIMRLAPIPMFYFPDFDMIEEMSAVSSLTTHGAQECVDACRLLGRIIARALAGYYKSDVLWADLNTFIGSPSIVALADGAGYMSKDYDDLRPTGYVVDTLEAALWCIAYTDTYKDAVLAAANLGGDADSIAAVTGQIAGAFYGAQAIPATWLKKLHMRREITALADRLGDHRR